MFLAARGLREREAGPPRLEDEFVAVVQSQAGRVWVRAAVAAAVLTLAAVLAAVLEG